MNLEFCCQTQYESMKPFWLVYRAQAVVGRIWRLGIFSVFSRRCPWGLCWNERPNKSTASAGEIHISMDQNLIGMLPCGILKYCCHKQISRQKVHQARWGSIKQGDHWVCVVCADFWSRTWIQTLFLLSMWWVDADLFLNGIVPNVNRCDQNLSLQSLGCELWHLEPMFISLIPPTSSASRRCKQIPLLPDLFSFSLHIGLHDWWIQITCDI